MLIDHYIWNKNCVKPLDWFSYLFFCGWIFKARTGKFCAPIRAVSLSFPQVGISMKAHKAWRVWRLRSWRLTHRVCGEQMKGVSDDARRIKTQRKRFRNNKPSILLDKTGLTYFGNREGEWKRRPSCLMSLPRYYRRPGSALSTGSTGWFTQTVEVGLSGRRDALKWIVTMVYWAMSLDEALWERVRTQIF